MVADRIPGYAVRHPESGALVSNRSFDNGYCVQPLTFDKAEAETHAAALHAATGTVWVLELAPGPCPACRRVIWADDLDFCYPLNRERTRWRAGCNEHDFGCGFEVEGNSFVDVMRLWAGQ
ncbi:hypothetical protein WJ96_06795 [Burkholderia ubonensis]|uniref:Uncharacterized protein n=2 Tax=Burkholderia ubonensis TaxID=101571 RepID=A0AAW3MXD4_9BURK|nr:hypothetical protein WJ97_13700 [Burkholderia ubonensis]KVP98225.1 hypothetical protein WJ96_06795 [Burkholderia ubonensis]KVZ92922.1 hypothetical protein WL25_18455 [Burkholderia ubonensis]